MRSLIIFWPLLIIFTFAVGFSRSADAAPNADRNSLEYFQTLKLRLLSLGIPQSDLVADYLTLELFYNVPNRKAVAANESDIRVEDLSLSFDSHVETLRKMFPGWEALDQNDKSVPLKSIRISGHDSKFVWDPKQPEIYFIWKDDGSNGASSEAGTLIFEEAAKRIPDLEVDFRRRASRR